MSLLVAFEMLELGMSPEQIVHTLREVEDVLARAARLAPRALLTTIVDEAAEPRAFFLCLDPNALAGLSGDPQGKALNSVFLTSGAQFARSLAEQEGFGRRLALINVCHMLESAARHLADREGIPPEKTYKALMDWGAEEEFRAAQRDPDEELLDRIFDEEDTHGGD